MAYLLSENERRAVTEYCRLIRPYYNSFVDQVIDYLGFRYPASPRLGPMFRMYATAVFGLAEQRLQTAFRWNMLQHGDPNTLSMP